LIAIVSQIHSPAVSTIGCEWKGICIMPPADSRISTAQRLSCYIDVERFPCTKFELLRHAEEGHAPDDILDCIEDMDAVVVSGMDVLIDCFAAKSQRVPLGTRYTN
jgi:hypothetical protein